MIKKLLILLILVGIFISGCDTPKKNQEIKIENDIRNIEFSCVSDNECDWMITNCCPEMNGAIWKCVNKIESKIVCPERGYGCEDSENPMPLEPCDCIDNRCQEKEIEQVEEEQKYYEKDEDYNFSYQVSVSKWVSGELPADEIGKKPIDAIIEEYRQNFNTIKITNNKVTIQQLFDKPTPCTNVNYTVSKIGYDINIIPKEIPDEPVYDPEIGEELLMGCIQVIATDFIEINFTLDAGKYNIYFYEYWDISKPSSNRTITIS